MTLESAAIAALSAVTMALCFLFQLLWKRSQDCEQWRKDKEPLIEEMARWRTEGRRLPHIVLCPHENVAVHMAGGYAAATGRGQAVLVHVDAGTANAAMALHNLFRARIAVLLLAGRAPATTFNGV